jgi:hypothetical protein
LPPFRHQFATATYNLPHIDRLGALLDGSSDVIFEFDAVYFRCKIYHHTWGVRRAFITEGTITTIPSGKFGPWPLRRAIGDFILDSNPSAACLTFAFRCDYEHLRVFYNQLSHALNEL